MLMQEWCRLREEIYCKKDLTRISQADPRYSYDTLRALYEQIYQQHMTRNFYLVRQYSSEFVARYRRGESIISIADWVGLSPVIVARRIMEMTLKADRRLLNRYLKNPETIPDSSLAEQVSVCVQVDDYNGPVVDRFRNVIGVEYEHLLLDYLRNLRLEFETEDDLRLRNSYKTPDVLLRVPVSFQEHVVWWIDSKAKFADEYVLNKDYTDSISSYVGRFGTGCIIYWFGFIEDCNCPMLNDSGVYVVDHFPQNVVTLPGAQLSAVEDAEITVEEEALSAA